MEWTNNIRGQIKPDIDYFPDNSQKNNWDIFRKSILKKYNYTCRFCGGYFLKYLNCVAISDTEFDIICYPCYIITHLNYGHNNQAKLYYSELNQLDIIRKTTDHIIKNGFVPDPYILDNNIKQIPLSLLEYINILKFLNHKKINIPPEFTGYKIFFSRKLNTVYIDANFLDKPNFVEIPELNKNIPEYKFSQPEKNFLDLIFK